MPSQRRSASHLRRWTFPSASALVDPQCTKRVHTSSSPMNIQNTKPAKRGGQPTAPRLVRKSRVLEGRPYPLGATWDGLGVNFALFSANATKVELCLFDP